MTGDVNGSGTIDIIDALEVVRYYVNILSPNFIACAADANKDGKIDPIDALLIEQCCVWIVPCTS